MEAAPKQYCIMDNTQYNKTQRVSIKSKANAELVSCERFLRKETNHSFLSAKQVGTNCVSDFFPYLVSETLFRSFNIGIKNHALRAHDIYVDIRINTNGITAIIPQIAHLVWENYFTCVIA